MRIVFTHPMGAHGFTVDAPPEYTAIPRVGDVVETADGTTYEVRTVVHYPWGDNGSAPFTYVVIR